jgi:hypothetical protein
LRAWSVWTAASGTRSAERGGPAARRMLPNMPGVRKPSGFGRTHAPASCPIPRLCRCR